MIDYEHYKRFIKDLTPVDRCDLLHYIERDIKIQLYDIFSDYLTLKKYKTKDGFDFSEGVFYFEDKPSLKDVSDEEKLELLNKLGFSDVSLVQSDHSESYFKIYASKYDLKPTGWYTSGSPIVLENGSVTGNPIWFGEII